MKLFLGLCASALLVSHAHGGVQFFTDHALFQQHNAQYGKVLKGIETFEESEADEGSKIPFPNPLQHGVPRPTFPNGIDETNLIIQTNITPGPCPPVPNPSTNAQALWVNGANFIGSNSIKVGTDEFLFGLFSSLDLIFTSHDKTAIGLDVSTFTNFNQGHGGFIVCAYDEFDNILGNFLIPGPTPTEPGKNFVGVWSSTVIGRVNIWGIFSVPQPFAVDNIEMWVPAPGAGSSLLFGGFWALRRRR